MTTLERHLAAWIGAWPPTGSGLHVIAEPTRRVPGWDGLVRPVFGVSSPDAGVIGVHPDLHEAVAALLQGLAPDGVDDDLRHRVSAEIAGGRTLGRGVMRWSVSAPSMRDLPDAGEWVARDDPRVPPWLRPFNDTHVLIAQDDAGRYGAGVGIKVHDLHGAEVAVVTEPALRGRGLARRLVAQAMRRVVGRGQVVTYLHAPDNVASARVAAALGMPDHGWSVWALFPESPPLRDGDPTA